MNFATFLVEGNADALEGVAEALAIEVDRQWRRGDRSRSGKTRETDGFSCTIADASSTRNLEDQLEKFSARCLEAGLNFRSLALTATLLVGVSVGDSEQFIASLEVPADVVANLGRVGVGLQFNAYPTSDHANAT